MLEILSQWTAFTNSAGDSTTGISGIRLFGIQISGSELKTSKLAPKGFLSPLSPQTVNYRMFWVLLGAFAIVMVMAIFISRSPVQREAIAGRDQHLVASTVGVPVFRMRVTMFVLGSVVAGAAGSLFVHWKTFASPDSFGIDLGLGIFVMLILGGIDSRWGPILGAFFYVFIPQWLQGGVLGIPGPEFSVTLQGQVHNASDFKNIIFGALLVIVMIAYPEGLVGIGRGVRGLVVGGARPARRTWFSDLLGLTPKQGTAARNGAGAEPAGDGAPAAGASGGLPVVAARAREPVTGDPVLEANDVSVSFGGVRAVDGVSLALVEGEILGLVGPNGSGKTTFLNAVNGIVPAHGALRVDGRAVRMGKPGRLRRRGVVRTFQAPQTYEHLSCIEDVLLSTPNRSLTGMVPSWLLRPWMLRLEHHRWETATAALERVGLDALVEESTARLSYGQRRLLELARAIAAEPRVLMLDEPSAGLNAAETERLAAHLRRLRDEGVSILLVDHKLDFITGLCDRVAVLELGDLVAVGPAATVFSDQRVVDAYLGVDEEDRASVLTDDGTAPAGEAPDGG